MKIRLACAIGLAATLVLPLIRAQDRPKLSLTGDRFRGLTYEEVTPAQKVIADRALAGRGAIGIFNITLRSPELSDAMCGISASRTQPLLSMRQNELAILLTGRYWTTQYEWMVHHRAAVRAGLSEETIAAIADGKRPAGLQPDEAVIYDFLSELLNLRQVLDPTFQEAKEKIGEKGIVDLIGLTGFYQTVSLMMNVDRFPLPAGQKPELARLANPLPMGGDMLVPSNAPENPTTAGPLRGDRFKPLAVDDMIPAQKALFDLIQSGKLEGGVNGPLNVLLRSPDIGEGILRYGAYEPFHTPLSAKLPEPIALTTSRAWTAQFPWYVHHRAATQAGLRWVTTRLWPCFSTWVVIRCRTARRRS